MDELLDEVHLYFNVFVVSMLNWIIVKLNGTMIVTLEGGRMLLLESKILKDLSKTQGFLTCINHCLVLYFH
jgi:hypothetical protein